MVERFINRLKHCRRVATRYDKLAATYLGFVQFALIITLPLNVHTTLLLVCLRNQGFCYSSTLSGVSRCGDRRKCLLDNTLWAEDSAAKAA